ncbi:MAG: Nif3-like dinuclear metal center hexameric protein [Oscillospiraceae bacterium]|nr:Nif3-like dinuclear metal center hexameric protein [Oscillospiraceae bacterium]
MTTVNDILEFMEAIAPMALKMPWDNAGLLCGSRTTPVTKILVALDPFEHVCDEAADWGAQLIVTHHPLIFDPQRAITDNNPVGRSILTLCRNGISAINAHTNLDQAEGGINDIFAQILGLNNIETICENDMQLLRCGEIKEQPLDSFLATVKEKLHCEGLRYCDGGKPVRKVAVGGGSCGGELYQAVRAGCDTFVTADVKYNQFWDAKDAGLNIIDAGHFCTENPVCAYLVEKIRAAFPDVEVKISETHADCIKYY